MQQQQQQQQQISAFWRLHAGAPPPPSLSLARTHARTHSQPLFFNQLSIKEIRARELQALYGELVKIKRQGLRTVWRLRYSLLSVLVVTVRSHDVGAFSPLGRTVVHQAFPVVHIVSAPTLAVFVIFVVAAAELKAPILFGIVVMTLHSLVLKGRIKTQNEIRVSTWRETGEGGL